MDERPKPSTPVLVKEVAPPLPRHSGVGVLAVASMAMLFAVSSATFLVRARMAGEGYPDLEHRSEPGAAAKPATIEPAPSEPCGEAVYRERADGTLTVTFDLCDSERSPTAGPEGIEVRAVHR